MINVKQRIVDYYQAEIFVDNDHRIKIDVCLVLEIEIV